MADVMLLEDKLRSMVKVDPSYDVGIWYMLNKDFTDNQIATTIVEAAEAIEAMRNRTEAYPESTIKEMRLTNQKLGADLLKSQMQIVNLKKERDELRKELELEAEKQTRLDILNNENAKLTAKIDAYADSFWTLAKAIFNKI